MNNSAVFFHLNNSHFPCKASSGKVMLYHVLLNWGGGGGEEKKPKLSFEQPYFYLVHFLGCSSSMTGFKIPSVSGVLTTPPLEGRSVAGSGAQHSETTQKSWWPNKKNRVRDCREGIHPRLSHSHLLIPHLNFTDPSAPVILSHSLLCVANTRRRPP